MSHPLDPRHFPDFSDKRVVGNHMDKFDTHGVSCRDFPALASVGVASGAARRTAS